MKISKKTTREQLAAIVVAKLAEHKISAVLVGGSVVSIYTDNKYPSKDLDFISAADHEDITTAMAELNFRPKGREFFHPNTEFTIEFPPGPLAIGNDEPVRPEKTLTIEGVKIRLFSPTQSVMDRLAWYYSTNDRQCLDQAVMVAKAQNINLDKVREWSKRERSLEKYDDFIKRLKKS
jgi:hypothetical protein